MNRRIFRQMAMVAGIGALVLSGQSLTQARERPTQGQQQAKQDKQAQKRQQQAEKQRAKQEQQAQKRQQQAQKQQAQLEQQAQQRQQQAQQQQDRRQGQQQQARGAQRQWQRLPAQEQRERITQNEQRVVQYRTYLDQQQQVAQQRSVDLQRQNRRAQYAFQEQYLGRLRQQQLSIRVQSGYNYDNDPYFYTPATYRYSRGGRYYTTNQYGVDLLNQAVTFGYDEGLRAGQADRQDRWRSSYQDSYAYQDASLGYQGFYVDRDDYNIYFREGFRRGYEDGYRGRYQYGRAVNGRVTIRSNVLSVILNFDAIR